jgi:hypothetical protein
MSRKKLAALLAAGVLALTVVAPVAAKGGPPKGVGEGAPPAGIQCQQAGIGTLQALKFDGKPLLATVAKAGVEVRTSAEPGDSLGVVRFSQVLRLHRTSPQLFGGDSAVFVVLPEGTTLDGEAISGPVQAFWCDFLFED